MNIVMVNQTKGHNKFWKVTVHGNTADVSWGSLGEPNNKGGNSKTFESSKQAQQFAFSKRMEKVNHGYTQVFALPGEGAPVGSQEPPDPFSI